MYRMFFNIHLDFHKIALILIFQNINIKYNPVNLLILVILIWLTPRFAIRQLNFHKNGALHLINAPYRMRKLLHQIIIEFRILRKETINTC
jgi:hypothetical protein